MVRNVTIHIKGKELSAILKKLIPDFLLTDKCAFANDDLILKCSSTLTAKIPQSKEDIFSLLCEEAPWKNELEQSR